jgi:NADH:ubiquinone oxidoreductase subunit
MGILSDIFTWWNGSTIGTRLFTSRHGEKVGEDSFGNTYYSNDDDSRRWVIYADETEGTRVAAEWYGWLHHIFDEPPTVAPLSHWEWQRDRLPNMTGTDDAYRPPGSLAAPGRSAGAGRNEPAYTPWVPE